MYTRTFLKGKELIDYERISPMVSPQGPHGVASDRDVSKPLLVQMGESVDHRFVVVDVALRWRRDFFHELDGASVVSAVHCCDGER